jgi:hypothetical protein
MKTLLALRAAVMVLSLGIGSAYADDLTVANVRFTEIAGRVAQPPLQNAHSTIATTQSGRTTPAEVSRRQSRDIWLFLPSPTAGRGSR